MGYLPYRYRPFGTFRLILALFVVCQHFVANAAPVGNLYATFLPYELGSLAVLVFFCLSGFVITEAVDQVYARKPAAYLINRFLRIVPHFVVAVVISIVIHRLFFDGGTPGLFNAQYMTRIARMARMPPKAMRWRPSVTL
jgi:peptidoglycan/LPS O-acetylase OafA/YrhL